jgi:hypothetical protein
LVFDASFAFPHVNFNDVLLGILAGIIFQFAWIIVTPET